MITTTTDMRVLTALLKRRRVTRKTAILNGWCENLTATISRLRQKGHKIVAIPSYTPEGGNYTRYKLLTKPSAKVIKLASVQKLAA